ncbi:MAG: hypothetical protein BWY70_01578 [Bacteroidetes bacterium ADurb.Bin408]|nr:MAG: hypothetical protein BWY70_01578 [Bacteroidetes bacterium ADurb.Bin408]
MKFSPKREVSYKYGRKVAVITFVIIFANLVASPHSEGLAVEDIGFGIILAVNTVQVFTSFEVTFFKGFLADWDKLAFVIGSARRFGHPANIGIPEKFLFTFHQTVNVRLQIFVIIYWNLLPEIIVVAYVSIAVFKSPFGFNSSFDKLEKPVPLNIMRVFNKQFNLVHALAHKPG